MNKVAERLKKAKTTDGVDKLMSYIEEAINEIHKLDNAVEIAYQEAASVERYYCGDLW